MSTQRWRVSRCYNVCLLQAAERYHVIYFCAPFGLQPCHLRLPVEAEADFDCMCCTPIMQWLYKLGCILQKYAGLRHDDLHDPVSGGGRESLHTPATVDQADVGGKGLPLEAASAGLSPLTSQIISGYAVSSGLKRISSCPSKLKDPAAVELVKPEYSRRNHKNFLDLYELGPVLGTGGYAVVRECTKLATGEKFAAKMMTVSEHPESGGREIAKQV